MNLSVFNSLSFLKASKKILQLTFLVSSLKTDEEKEKNEVQISQS